MESEQWVNDLNFEDMVNGIDGRSTDQFLFFDSKDIKPFSEESGRCPYRLNFPTMVVCCLEGETRVKVNSREYHLTPGCVCVLIEGETIQQLGELQSTHYFILACNDANFMYSINNTLLLLETKNRIEECACFRLSDNLMHYYTSLYNLMDSTIRLEDQPFKNEILQSYIRILFYYSCSEITSATPLLPVESNGRGDDLLKRFLQLVPVYFKENREIQFYADKLCITPKHLSTSIRKASGRYARDIITDYVIAEAKNFLLGSQMTIQQISDSLNFATQSFFGKYFKQHIGCSPAEYRERNKNK